jgi:hypothetical protein
LGWIGLGQDRVFETGLCWVGSGMDLTDWVGWSVLDWIVFCWIWYGLDWVRSGWSVLE